MESNRGVSNAIPVNPKRILTDTIVLFLRENIFLELGSAFSNNFFVLRFLMLAMILSLISTKEMAPTNPPNDVTTTASKKENPNPKAIGTEPKTNLTVLTKKTQIISQIPCSTFIKFYFRMLDHRHRPGREL